MNRLSEIALPALTLLLTGCPSDDPKTDSDTGPPTDTTTREPATATLRVYTDGALADAAPVFVADATGAWVQTLATDAAGEATIADLPVDGSVTVGLDSLSDRALYTIFGVQDGDDLVFGVPDDPGMYGPGGAITYDLVAHPTLTGGTHRLYAECGGSGSGGDPPVTDASVTLREGCTAGDVDVLAVYYQTSGYDGIAASYIRTTVPVTGEPPSLTGDVSLTGWSTAHGTVAASLTGAPTGAGVSVDIDGVFGDEGFSLADAEGTGDGGVVGTAAPVEPTLLDGAFALTQVRDPDGTATVRADLVDPLPAAGSTTTLAFTMADLLPTLDIATQGSPRGIITGLDGSEACGSETLDAVGGILVETRSTKVENRWVFGGPPAATFTLPGLDPAVAEDWWSTAGTVDEEVAQVIAVGGPERTIDDWRTEPGFPLTVLSPQLDTIGAFRCFALGVISPYYGP